MAKLDQEQLKKMAEGRKRRRQEIADSGEDNKGQPRPGAPRLSDMTHGVHDGSGGTVEVRGYTRAKAIRTMCSTCMPGANPKTDCTSPKCPRPLDRRSWRYPYRGKVRL